MSLFRYIVQLLRVAEMMYCMENEATGAFVTLNRPYLNNNNKGCLCSGGKSNKVHLNPVNSSLNYSFILEVALLRPVMVMW